MARRRCVFLTIESLKNYISDDEVAIPYLEKLGWQVSQIPWRAKNVHWSKYDLVVIRTTWDYQQAPEVFLQTLKTINKETRLYNSLQLVEWNMNKQYLRDLQQCDIAIVPTLWFSAGTEIDFHNISQMFDCDTLIFKPVISANADYTFRVNQQDLMDVYVDLKIAFAKRDFMVQAFMPSVVTEGEFSLFFFSGEYSHAILKSPKSGDFRVQEEHGGTISAIYPSTELLNTAGLVLGSLPEVPLYARVDFVRSTKENYCLMELELVEPSLYFRFDDNAAKRFAEAIDGV